MNTDKYGIKIKVGDYVFLDSYTGMEYGTSAGKMVQIKKIGSRRISFDAGYKNLRSAQFGFITAYTLVSYQKWTWVNNEIFYKPMFIRTATNEQRYKAIVDGLLNGSNKEVSDALIKNETYAYEQRVNNYQLKNSGHAFHLDIGGYKFVKDNINLPIIEEIA